MKFNSVQNDFSIGEVSRYLKGRTNIDEYFRGVDDMTNFIPMKQGGATFRPGFYISENYWLTNVTQPWAMFEFTPRDGETYLVALNPSNGANQIKITRVNGGGAATVSRDTYIWNAHADFLDSSAAYDSAANVNHTTLLDSLQVVQNGDTFLIFDGTGQLAPITVLRIAVGSFIVDSILRPQKLDPNTGLPYTFSPVAPFMRSPYTDTNINTNLRLKPSATSGTITIGAEDGAAAAKSFFKGDVVGMHVKITHSAVTGVALITSKVSDSVVNAIVTANFGAATASSNFEVAMWNPRDGYPKSCAFFEGRLALGGSPGFPDTLWLSLTGNIYHFMQRRLAQDLTSDTSGTGFFGGLKDSDPFNFIPASTGANGIQWLFPSDTLIVGTTRNEFSITGTDNGSIGPTTTLVKPISSHGSSKVQPVKIGSSIVFVSYDGKRLLEIPKRLVEYTAATELSSMAEGILDKSIQNEDTEITEGFPIQKVKTKIVKLAWQEAEATLWVICRNREASQNSLLSFTYDRTSKAVGWAKHIIAGAPSIASICVLPDINKGNYPRLFIFLQRKNAPYYSLEYMCLRNNYDQIYIGNPDDTADGGLKICYLDGASHNMAKNLVAGNTELTLSAVLVAAHAPGSTLAVFAIQEIGSGIGDYIGDYTVDGSNKITIPSQDLTSTTVIVGARYSGSIRTLPIEAGAQFGVAQGSLRRGHEVSIYIDRGLGGSYTQYLANDFMDIVTQGSSSALFTGEVRLSLNASPDDNQTVIKQDQPYPLTVLWLLTKGYTYDS